MDLRSAAVTVEVRDNTLPSMLPDRWRADEDGCGGVNEPPAPIVDENHQGKNLRSHKQAAGNDDIYEAAPVKSAAARIP